MVFTRKMPYFTLLQGGYHPQYHPTKAVLHVHQNTKPFNGCYRQGLMIGGNALKHKYSLWLGIGYGLGGGDDGFSYVYAWRG